MAEPGEPLTERELEIVRLLATGAANKEIAAKLHISPNTVRVHLRNIFTKLEAQSRTEVTMIAVRNGWIALDIPRHSGESTEAGEEGAELAPSQGRAQSALPVLVAPDPRPLPPLPWWRRVALVSCLVLGLGASALLIAQRPIAVAPASADGSEVSPIVRNGQLVKTNDRWHPRDSMRTARTRSAVALVEGEVFAIAGEANGVPTSETLIYSPQQDTWRVGPEKPTPVSGAAAAVLDGLIYVLGGTTPDGQLTRQVEILDPRARAWRSGLELPQPLTAHAAAATKDAIFVLGGRASTGITAEVHRLDRATQRWERLPPMPTPRSQLAAVVLSNRLYAIGGFDGQRELSTCEALDLEDLRWRACAPMTLPRGGHAAAVLGSVI
ncbi:MAG: LuxR C-terminal-related transcriptional regulator, partial [Thermoflexales bacterium]|nr:LuxR C-terminal-related transcriptional regulator [Thermoflexales bacterium]